MHRRVAAAGLVAFLAIDIGLVVMALRSGRDAPTASPQAATTLTTSFTTPAATRLCIARTPPPPHEAARRPLPPGDMLGANRLATRACPRSRQMDAGRSASATTLICDSISCDIRSYASGPRPYGS